MINMRYGYCIMTLFHKIDFFKLWLLIINTNPGEKVRNQALLLISDTQSRTDRWDKFGKKRYSKYFIETTTMTIEIFPRDQDNVNFRLKERLRLCRAWRLGLKIFQYFYIFGGWAWEYFDTSIFLDVGLENI